MEEGLSTTGQLITLAILFGAIGFWVWWMNRKNPQPKLDFGPTKEEHGIFYYIWNWKTYAFYLLLIVGAVIGFVESGIVVSIQIVLILYGLKLLGKLF